MVRESSAAYGFDLEGVSHVSAETNLSDSYRRHPNTAFGLAFALDYAKTTGDRELESV